jgi:PAS domain S-box-containing protein
MATLEAAQIGLWEGYIKDFALTEQWSPRFREIFGLPLEAEASKDLFLKCVHPEDRERIERAVVEAVSGANGGRYRAEYRIVQPTTGSVRWVKAWGQAFMSREGKIDRLIGTILDVTAGKLLEEENARLQAEFRDLFEEAPIPYVHESLNTRFIRVNRAARKLLGIEPDNINEIFGRSLVAATPENERRMRDSLSLVGTGREIGPVLLELRRKDNGNPVWIHRWSKPAPGGDYARTMYWDVTDWVLTEQAKTTLELTLESGQIGDWDLDLINDTSRRSLRHDQCFGYSTPIPEDKWGVEVFMQHVHSPPAEASIGPRKAKPPACLES